VFFLKVYLIKEPEGFISLHIHDITPPVSRWASPYEADQILIIYYKNGIISSIFTTLVNILRFVDRELFFHEQHPYNGENEL